MPEHPNPYHQRQWLWRAVDEHGQTLDVLLPAHRDTTAAKRFFRRLLVVTDGVPPVRITTDKLGSYAAAVAMLPELVGVAHLQVRSALRCNSGATIVLSRPTNPRGSASA